MAAHQLAKIGAQHITQGVGHLTKEVFQHGKGSYMTTMSGRRLLDFACGIGVTNLGHTHPGVTKAVQEQAGKISHCQVSLGYSKPYVDLITALLPLMPHASLDTFFFANSGAEAVESAVRVARKATGRPNIIVMQGGFHGRTYATASMTKSKTIFSEGLGSTMPGVFTVPFPYCAQCPVSKCSKDVYGFENCCSNPVTELELLFQQQTKPSDTAALIIEPVLGEGGYVPAPRSYLETVRKICDKHGVLLIIDEVQTGFGRTGKMFAIEHYGVQPDIMVMAKGLANGYPLSAIVTRKDLSDRMSPGSMGGTYTGNAVACAAAVAVTEAFKRERILENVAERGRELREMLDDCARSDSTKHMIHDVRGYGLMLGLEFCPGKNYAARVQQKCLEEDLIILTTSIYDTLRFIPALNITKDDMRKGIEIVRTAIGEVAREELN